MEETVESNKLNNLLKQMGDLHEERPTDNVYNHATFNGS
jgi:hypothetical protein